MTSSYGTRLSASATMGYELWVGTHTGAIETLIQRKTLAELEQVPGHRSKPSIHREQRIDWIRIFCDCGLQPSRNSGSVVDAR